MGTPIPHNRAAFTLAEIAGATGGEVLSPGALGDAAAVGVSTDTRVLERGAAFVALRGASFDGHAMLDTAAAAGASVAVVERDVDAPAELAIVRVGSTLDALGALARAHARRWRALGGERRMVAITGSAGKTTTRIAVAALLGRMRPGSVHATYGNLNNLVGAPMVLLGLEAQHRFAVVEVGTNKPGEIAALASIVEPDVAVLTLVAAAHVEGLGSLDGVAEEKGALLRVLAEDGVAVGNGDDPRVARELARSAARRRITYGFGEACDVRVVERVPVGLHRARLRVERAGQPSRSARFETPLVGEAGGFACAAAVAVAEALFDEPVTSELAGEAFAGAEVGGGAGRLVPRLFEDGLAVIDDSYNANPASSCASIRTAAEIARATGRRLVLVLGEMRELGVESARGHDDVGRAAAASGAAAIVAVVGEAKRIAERAREAGAEAVFVGDVGAAAATVLSAVRPGDLVLVKGSRGVATERVVRALADAHDDATAPDPEARP
jgi:UDP-N-acetylmuramoyl-tripeptide--D-alanyl-D-alanine ligase